MNEQQERLRRAADRLQTQVTILGSFVGIIWVLELADVFLLGQALNAYGVIPRQPIGLRGILMMPLLHGGLAHVAANTLPFIVLGWLVMLRRVADFIAVTITTMLVTGVGLWFFGAGRSVYIGASGLIFGYFGFLLWRGYYERSGYAVLVAVFVAIFYGGLIWGIFPQQPGVSWEAHLLGLLGGVMAARMLST
ncbi:MAG: rhomboid family intramembrane serine protease [Candidatus Promineifilaceae bacterium]|nr:rhomboid family intramembrane serine protease [Candidatus Promineifilaceae bacterium]